MTYNPGITHLQLHLFFKSEERKVGCKIIYSISARQKQRSTVSDRKDTVSKESKDDEINGRKHSPMHTSL